MKLIVLRGNSGSGKSTIAKEVRLAQSEHMAYVEQDYVRRILLKEHDIAGGRNIQLLKDIILFALKNSYHVIAEGIFRQKRYETMFQEILKLHPTENYFFYFDISFEETLRRHQTKPNKHEFGEQEMRTWHEEKDFLHDIREEIISEKESIRDSINHIFSTTGIIRKKIYQQ